MDVKKGGICISIILLISIFGITTITALNTNEWHSANKISFNSWYSMTLGRGISTLEDIVSLKSSITDVSESDADSAAAGGHKASEIWVSVRNGEMTLLQAINSGTGGLCPPNDITNITYFGPTDKTQAYHYGTEVEVTIDGVTTSLQDAINGGTFCWNYYWATSSWIDPAGCGTLTHTRTVNCVKSDIVSTVADSYCTEAKPATSETYFHQCYLHRLSWGNNGCGGVACCCPFGQVTIGTTYFSWTTCSSYGSHYYAYQDTGCFLLYGSCDWEDWSCY